MSTARLARQPARGRRAGAQTRRKKPEAQRRRPSADHAAGGQVRLVKGAFADPRPHAHQGKAAIDANSTCAGAGCWSVEAKASSFRPVFGTHDEALTTEIRRTPRTAAGGLSQHEFEIYGVRTEYQRVSCAAGEQVRIYPPHGRDWWPMPCAVPAKARATPCCWRARERLSRERGRRNIPADRPAARA